MKLLNKEDLEQKDKTNGYLLEFHLNNCINDLPHKQYIIQTILLDIETGGIQTPCIFPTGLTKDIGGSLLLQMQQAILHSNQALQEKLSPPLTSYRKEDIIDVVHLYFENLTRLVGIIKDSETLMKAFNLEKPQELMATIRKKGEELMAEKMSNKEKN